MCGVTGCGVSMSIFVPAHTYKHDGFAVASHAEDAFQANVLFRLASHGSAF